MFMTPAGALPLNPPRSLPHGDQLLSSGGMDADSCIKLRLGGVALHGDSNALHDFWGIFTNHMHPNHLHMTRR